jgi:hypothetical protein
VRQALSAGDLKKAQSLLDLQFDSNRDNASTQVNRLINILGAEAKSSPEEADSFREWTYRVTLGLLIGGTAATLLIALALAYRPRERTQQAFSMIERVGVLHAQTEQGAAQILDAAAELNRQAAALQHGARQFTRRVRAA